MMEIGIEHHEHIHQQIKDVIDVLQQHVVQRQTDKHVHHIIGVVLHQ